MTGFGVSQATVAEKHPPGVNCQTIGIDLNCAPDGLQFNVVQICAFNVVQVIEGPVCELSEYLTWLMDAQELTLAEQNAEFMRWYPLAAGGVAYGYSNGPVKKLHNLSWDSAMQLIYSQDKTLPPAKTQEVWLLNCNIRLSNIWG